MQGWGYTLLAIAVSPGVQVMPVIMRKEGRRHHRSQIFISKLETSFLSSLYSIFGYASKMRIYCVLIMAEVDRG